MSKLKEVNFWLIYIFITAMIILFALLTFFNEWQSVKNKYLQQLSSLNRITSQNTLSSFRHQESTLKILGKNLLSIDAYNYPEFGRKTISEMIEVNKGLVAFGLARYDGQLLIVSNIPKGKKLPNLMRMEKSKDSFKIARDSTKMMLGRTYKLKTSNTWGMPIRMAIKNRYGENPLVMTAGIRLDGGDSALNLKEIPMGYLVQVVRSDGYIQFQNPIKEKEYEKVYYEEFSPEILKKIKSIKDDEIHIFDSLLTGKESISAVIFLEDFNLYSIVSIPYEIIYNEYFKKVVIWVIILLLLLFVLFIIFRYSINLQKIASNKLKYIARHDSLTNLPNRLSFHEEVERRVKNKEKFYILFLDLDNFKYVNDTYGHIVGDQLLKKVSLLLRKVLLENDFLARQGGDEFILLIDEKQHEPIRNLANKVLELFSNEIIIDNNEIYTGTSIGISKSKNGQDSVSDLLNKADIALYKAKERKNSYIFFSDELYKESKQFLEIELNLRKAIKNREFFVVYQPKIDASSRKIIGVEALLRWKNDYLGFISPEVFIPVAERNGLIHEIGDFVIKTAQKEMFEIWNEIENNITLSINVSPRQISSKNDMHRFEKSVNKSSFPNEYFIIEVTENVFIREATDTINLLKKLRAYNVGISLDDFGTGYSSLSILSKLPITELKIDKSFIQNMLLNEDNLMLVKSIINIAKEMRLKVVAEGVESKKELELLDEMGCEIYQGYYFSKPLSKNELIKFIKNQK